MKKYGLIGYPLTHSFSKKYFSDKFIQENILNTQYELYELKQIDLIEELFAQESELLGLNVTIPYKETVIPFLDALDPNTAGRLQAVNVIKIKDGQKVGYNSDFIGFKSSLMSFIEGGHVEKALILGTGGASKAVQFALEDLGISYQFVSRKKTDAAISYEMLDESIMSQVQLIINTTPLGTYPQVEGKPDIPYDLLHGQHYLFDLVYNPEVTAFLKEGVDRGAHIKNGLSMLHGQAEAAWDIWNRD